jgi:CMP-N,N'-diacetyllegionaminic acid synthase
MSLRVLHLITARGGSKGVPGKNLRKIGGLSLVGFKAISALGSRYCTRAMISTDSPEIQEEARRYGVEAPFLRPAELATDSASSMDVLAHAMDFVEREGKSVFDAVMLLEPSSPFATSQDLDKAVELMERAQASAVVGIRAVHVNSIFQAPVDNEFRLTQLLRQIPQGSARRQDLPQEYTLSGTLYLVRWESFKKHHSIYGDPENTYGYVMDPAHSLEIDEPLDLAWAEFLVERKMIDLNAWKSRV